MNFIIELWIPRCHVHVQAFFEIDDRISDQLRLELEFELQIESSIDQFKLIMACA